MRRKLNLYLDTSTISHLFADDAPDKMRDTNLLWRDFEQDKFDLFISQTVLDEVRKCAEPKRGQMLEKLQTINFQLIQETATIQQLADAYIQSGVLKEKSIDDCMHIAFAVIGNCNIIISWNFKHLVNYKTINSVKIVNAINNYREISIMSPNMLLEEVNPHV